MKGKICYIDQNNFLHQAVNVFFSAVKLGILTWGVYGIDSIMQSAFSGHSMNFSLSHFCVGFMRESGRLPLGYLLLYSIQSCLIGQIRCQSLAAASWPVWPLKNWVENGKCLTLADFHAAQTNQELALAVMWLRGEAENPKKQWRTN